VEYNYDEDEKPDPSVYMDIDRQIKANKAHGRFERQSAFAGQEMKVPRSGWKKLDLITIYGPVTLDSTP